MRKALTTLALVIVLISLISGPVFAAGNSGIRPMSVSVLTSTVPTNRPMVTIAAGNGGIRPILMDGVCTS